MLKDNKSTSNIPKPSLKKGAIIDKLTKFIEETLLIFQKENKGQINTPEKELNQKLALTFEKHSRIQEINLIFQQETIQKQNEGHNRTVDIGVFKLYGDLTNPIYTIEGKRLTTEFPNNRKKEYVLGNDENKKTGGIERFKHNLHGINLKHSALVGYVQRENSKYWFDKINNWIKELIDNIFWNETDLLINTCNFKYNKLAIFISINKRIDNSDITLNHYFVDLNR